MSANPALQEVELDFELILEDGIPLESWYHRLQMNLFLEVARVRLLELSQRDFLLNGNMFIYYSVEQARAVAEEQHQLALFEQGLRPDKPKLTAYRGPDAFLIKNVSTHKRDVWKVWEEDDRYPDLILELLSPSTADTDYGTKKKLYQDVFKTSEYFLYTPDSEHLDGFRLLGGAYQPIRRSNDRRWSRELEAEVGVWHGEHEGQTARWLRLFHPDGSLVPTHAERAGQERLEKEAAEQRAEQERLEKEAAEQRAEQERLEKEAAEQKAAAAAAALEAAEQKARELLERIRRLESADE